MRQFPPPTRSGHARLWYLDDVDARALENGDVLLTRWPTGYLPLIILGPRESETGELGEAAQPCVVVDAIVAAGTLRGRKFAFAPVDLLRVDVRGKVR